MFVDFVEIYVKAGDGGAGAVSFHRERFVPFGGPDGGDGGAGGNVLFVADFGMKTLVDFKYKKRFMAENGFAGGKNNRFGKNGRDLLIKVPQGTLIHHKQTNMLMAEIVSNVEPVVIARGGRGGFGNSRFKNSVRRSPKFAKPGGFGQEFELCLELKLLADVGLVGFPNVGKSTLLSVISSAKPKIGNYAFTTLSPVLGVVRVGEGFSFVVADIPGLIEGASDGAGLGFSFLRHIQKCRLLVHVVDVSVSSETSAEFDLKVVSGELERFDENLLKKPRVILANKIDAVNSKKLEELRNYAFRNDLELFEISAANLFGVEGFVEELSKKLKVLPAVEAAVVDFVEESYDNDRTNSFDVVVEDGIFNVVSSSKWLSRILMNSRIDDYENLQYFQKLFKRIGLEDRLKKMGIKNGDVVNIQGFYFEYFD